MMRPSEKKPSAKRLRAERAGRLAESLAALYLRLTFHRILAQRYKSPVGEIDLVASRGRSLVFVEVKTRGRASSEAQALDTVNRRRIARAAQHFIGRHPGLADRPMRFDVIFLAPDSWPRHVRNAFPGEVR